MSPLENLNNPKDMLREVKKQIGRKIIGQLYHLGGGVYVGPDNKVFKILTEYGNVPEEDLKLYESLEHSTLYHIKGVFDPGKRTRELELQNPDDPRFLQKGKIHPRGSTTGRRSWQPPWKR